MKPFEGLRHRIDNDTDVFQCYRPENRFRARIAKYDLRYGRLSEELDAGETVLQFDRCAVTEFIDCLSFWYDTCCPQAIARSQAIDGASID